ncbi:phenylalanine--tRNA ligase subunit alpha [Fluviispira vulneris]|uniref:phenylalanine--tRNA ligase subunit alpha n=1 Tax=Fluviispira vulneris TaxID=2763012 RepID=UPI001647979A|nr:phenylalanine--tRNA ligase subunit alpha [Fluviispira vulneris]
MSGIEEIKNILTAPISVSYQNIEELIKHINDERVRLTQVVGENGLNSPDLNIFSNDIMEEIRIRFTGKKSPLQEWLKSLRNIPADERKNAGAKINELKAEIESCIKTFSENYRIQVENKKLNSEMDDITLPFSQLNLGSRHPVITVMRDLMVPFQRMGFSVVDGPEMDNDFYNFEALNVLKDHPAREMQDTFFLASEWVLRTHTSNVQSHAMKERKLPLKIVCPGCVYRNEFDMTHLPAFRQIECLVVDKGIHMGHLRHTINELLNAAFGRSVKLRFRSSYFPFTEPSAEVDVECQQCFGKGCRSCKHTGWSEIGGCGVVNKKVLESCGIDSSVYGGIAFGFGVDRIAKDRFAVSDLRSFIDGNVSFLKSFGLV